MKTYYIESNAAAWQHILLNKKWNHELPEFKTPYTGKIWGMEISIPEEDAPKFLKMICALKKRDYTRLYSKEKNQYCPIILKNQKTPYLYTTFIYKMLEHGECFVSPQEDMINLNLLEEFEIDEDNFLKEFNWDEATLVRGYYRSATRLPFEEINNVSDIGTLNVCDVAKNQTHQVRSILENIRFIEVGIVKSPYDELFGFPNGNGVTKKEFVEHYIPYTESSVIHFADDIGIIELYNKADQMELEPIHTFQKDKEYKKFIEQDILKTIEEYKKKMVGSSRNRIPDND